jgi:hypothetical protein
MHEDDDGLKNSIKNLIAKVKCISVNNGLR